MIKNFPSLDLSFSSLRFEWASLPLLSNEILRSDILASWIDFGKMFYVLHRKLQSSHDTKIVIFSSFTFKIKSFLNIDKADASQRDFLKILAKYQFYKKVMHKLPII